MSTKIQNNNATAKSSVSPASSPKKSTPSHKKGTTPRVIKEFMSYLTMAFVKKDVSFLNDALEMVKSKKIRSKSFIKSLVIGYKKLRAPVPLELQRQPKVAEPETEKENPVVKAVEAIVQHVQNTVSDEVSEESSSSTIGAGSGSSALMTVVEAVVEAATSSTSTAIVLYGSLDLGQSWADAAEEEEASEVSVTQKAATSSGANGLTASDMELLALLDAGTPSAKALPGISSSDEELLALLDE